MVQGKEDIVDIDEMIEKLLDMECARDIERR